MKKQKEKVFTKWTDLEANFRFHSEDPEQPYIHP